MLAGDRNMRPDVVGDLPAHFEIIGVGQIVNRGPHRRDEQRADLNSFAAGHRVAYGDRIYITIYKGDTAADREAAGKCEGYRRAERGLLAGLRVGDLKLLNRERAELHIVGGKDHVVDLDSPGRSVDRHAV